MVSKQPALNPKYAKSRANHKKVRAALKRKGLCIWRCGRKTRARKVGRGKYVLCPQCQKKNAVGKKKRGKG